MKLDVEQLVEIIRDARISELAVTADETTVKLRKPLRNVASPRQTVESPPLRAVSKEEPVVEAKEAVFSLTHICAPMVGIFHGIESMGGIGASVKIGQVVGSIESMKLMNDVVSEYEGVIAEMFVEDGMPVEFGQNLFALRKV